MLRVFLSYQFEDQNFVQRINYYLQKQPGLDPFCYGEEEGFQRWDDVIMRQLATCHRFILFCTPQFFPDQPEGTLPGLLGGTQVTEARAFYNRHRDRNFSTSFRVVLLQDSQVGENPGELEAPAAEMYRNASNRIPVSSSRRRRLERECPDEDSARWCARRLAGWLNTAEPGWVEADGLPIGYPFDYEKDVIDEFFRQGGVLLRAKQLGKGCPVVWPDVSRISRDGGDDNPIPEQEIGAYRDDGAKIIVDVRSKYHGPIERCPRACLVESGLSFREAGPRKRVAYRPDSHLNIGIVVSGGIAPGINSVIAGIVERHYLYYLRGCEKEGWQPIGLDGRPRLKILLYRDGFEGLRYGNHMTLTLESVRELAGQNADLGGSLSGTSRFDELLHGPERDTHLSEVVDRLVKADEIDILYVIGGDGSMKAAHAIYTRARQDQRNRSNRRGLSVVGIPKTMDNDILWVWQSFGFLSAVERAKQVIMQLHTEVQSNPRLCVIQLFGSDSGFVVSHAALAAASCDAALIPEVPFRMSDLSRHIQHRLQRRYDESPDRRTYGMILLAETAIPRDVEAYIDDPAVMLEEDEKEAIRTFIGSPFLTAGDIVDWGKFCTAVTEHEADPVKVAVFRALPGEIQGIVTSVAAIVGTPAAGLWDEDALKSIVLKALNESVIERGVLSDSDAGAHDGLPEEVKMLSFIRAELGTSPDDQRSEQILQGLAAISLPHEARWIREDFERIVRSKEEAGEREDERRKLDRQWGLLRQRLAQLLSERINRLLLERAFPGVIRPCRALPDAGRVYGQTPDKLRTGGLKIVSRVLLRDIREGTQLLYTPDVARYRRYCQNFRVFTNEPRHLLRAIPPSVSDVVFGHRLGVLAVDNAMAGYTDFMVSQWLTEYVLVPLELVVLGRKRVPQNGIFWKSVLAKTGSADLFRPVDSS